MIVLLDTSAWIDHFRRKDPLADYLIRMDRVCTHDVVVGELALGSHALREATLSRINLLPRLAPVPATDCLVTIQRFRLWGRGIGWSDVQLLTSALRSKVPLYTKDTRLLAVMKEVKSEFQLIDASFARSRRPV